MSSRILYDTRDNSILRCNAKPKGSAGLPSFEALCKSARVTEDDKQYMNSTIIDGDYLTKQAREQLRIIKIDGKIAVKNKPRINLSVNYNTIFAGETIKLIAEITEQLESDNFQSVKMKINDIDFKINIKNNQGSKEIELQEPDTYKIDCIDHRFINQPVEVEVV